MSEARIIGVALAALLLPGGAAAQAGGDTEAEGAIPEVETRTHAAAMAAHHLCAGTLVVGRDHRRSAEQVQEADIARFEVFAWRPDFEFAVDEARGEASVWGPGIERQTAEYNGDQGCTILPPGTAATPGPDVLFEPVAVPRSVPDPATTPWPAGDLGAHHDPLPPEVDAAALDAALDRAMAEEVHHTRALLVVYDGKILAERYAEGFGPNTPQISWSQGKSIAAALLGTAIEAGYLDVGVDDPAPVPEWRAAGDPRRAIRVRDLLNMSSGLDFQNWSARDWARFGLLHLWDGVWEGERILPEGWVEFVRTPAPGDPERNYGGFFWLNRGGMLPRAPEDTYFAAGFMGQFTAIVPSRDLVVVRLGPSEGDIMAYLSDIIGDVLDAIDSRSE
ncbi:MAG: serine hydrolase domain-containing protein [Gemmatimonadota bacterium]